MEEKAIKATKVGIRIRKARAEASISLRKLSEAVGVSAVYIGMVERGERNPSRSLLEKIAMATNSPLSWLEESLADDTDSLAVEQEIVSPAPSETDTDAEIDIPFFLALASRELSLKKDQLAAMLNVSLETVEGIFAGGGCEAAPHWDDCFSSMAKQMDLPAVCRKLRTLEAFLLRENAEKKHKCLIAALKRAAGAGYQLCASVAMNKTYGSDLHDVGNTPFMYIAFRKGGISDGEQLFAFCRIPGAIDRDVVRDIVDDQLSRMKKTQKKFTFVFEDRSIRDLFLEECHRRQSEAGSPTDKSDDGIISLSSLSLLLVDRDTWEDAGEPVDLGEKKRVCLYVSLKRMAGAGYQLYGLPAVQETDTDGLGNTGSLYAEHIVLRKNGVPAEDKHYVFCRLPDDGIEDDVLRDFVVSQISCDNADALPVFVSDSEEILNAFRDEHERLETTNAAMDELAEGHGHPEPLPLSLLRADHDTWEVIDEF